ncbi:MAG: transposase [Candidatus Aenigmarchaeota archaeon]|nr:transposase [Candidatus Aenigmarchaeota archaeon]
MTNNQKTVGLFLGISFSIARNSVWYSDDFTRLLVRAASHDTYVEVIKNDYLPGPDSLHRRIGENPITVYHGNFHELTDKYLKKIGNREVILILDYTHEPFYGKSSSYWIHEYKPEKGCTGSFRFLVASILCEGERFFVDCIPANLFSDTAKLVERMLDGIKLKISVVLLDRGFASEDMIRLLKAKRLKYLMLCPEWTNIHRILKRMNGSYLKQEFKVGNTDTTLVIVKDKYEWIFVTNIHYYHLNKYIRIYKLRWNIETGFRVQDEARIKSKSLSIAVRYFLFLIGLLLYNVWKYLSDSGQKMQFKRFVINFFDLMGLESMPNT